jgi:RHS repeat-associated protein
VNHLGNILSTISDRKLMHEDLPNNPGVVHHYTAEILSVQEQYAFGMNMPGRSFSVEEYRYGFNGKENQDELMADNSSQDFGARMYDARVGRWWGMDPNAHDYAHLSPYNSFENNPIYFNDPDGKDATVTIVGNTIYISSKIYIYGIDANEDIRSKIQSAIEVKWGRDFKYKGYNVKFNVQVELWTMDKSQDPMESGSNLIEINNNVPNGRSYVVDGKTGRWSKSPSQWAHEFGHLVGFDDGYIEYYEYGIVQGEKPKKKLWIKNAFGTENIMSNSSKDVEQKNIDWMCEYILERVTNGKFEIKGIIFSPPLDESERYYKANEVPGIEKGMKHSPSNEKVTTKPKSNKPVTRYRNVRNL